VIAYDLQRWTRRADSVARIGDTMFAVLLPNTPREGALLVAHRLSRATRRSLDEARVPATVTFGLATHPDEGHGADTLLDTASPACETTAVAS
jgi:GGDEF domain-containing protein